MIKFCINIREYYVILCNIFIFVEKLIASLFTDSFD